MVCLFEWRVARGEWRGELELKVLRYFSRAFLLVVAVLCVLGVFSGRLDGVLPALSPFVGITTALGSRIMPVFLLLCFPVLLLAVFWQRWFCRNACPVGLLLEIVGRMRKPDARKKHLDFPKLGGWIVFLAIGGALAGYPLFVWLDPLAMLSSFLNVLRGELTGIALLPAAGFLTLIVISIWRPNLWCGRICPLGASQELLRKVATAGRKKADTERGRPALAERRLFLGLVAGGVLGGTARKVTGKTNVIRPPGSVPENRFTAMCSRCGTCAAVCPERIIQFDLGRSGLAGLMTPSIDIRKDAYCSELCNECSKTCPTGAIGRGSLEDKQNISIGIAEVIKPLCLCWEKHEFCMLCADFCPYDAVAGVDRQNVKCPEIIEDKCRGCGACQVICPVSDLAIIVKGRSQKQLNSVRVKVVRDLIEHRS